MDEARYGGLIDYRILLIPIITVFIITLLVLFRGLI